LTLYSVYDAPKPTLERRLLIEHHEGEERGPQECGVPDQHRATENEGLPEDDGEDSDIHRVPHVPVQPRHHQVGGGRDRSRRAKPLDREPVERFHDDGRAQNDEEVAEWATCRHAEQWRFHAPAGEQPRDVPGHHRRSDPEKDEGTDQRAPSSIHG
jgi:hypothetical protein